MFTLVVCLVVVAFSGAAVVHIVLSDAPQRATLRTPPRRDRPTGPPIPSVEEAEPGPAPPLGVVEASPQPPDERWDRSHGHQPRPDAGRVRSVALLVEFLTAVAGLLAAAVTVVVALVAVALLASLA